MRGSACYLLQAGRTGSGCCVLQISSECSMQPADPWPIPGITGIDGVAGLFRSEVQTE